VAGDLALVPAERREAAWQALAAAGIRDPRGLSLLKGGVSGALIYRVESGARPVVLRMEPERVALEHRARGFACMQAAAAVGVAPAVRHADAAQGVAVMDFVGNRPVASHPGGPAGLARDLGGLVARLQGAERFPRPGDDDVVATLLDGLRGSGMFAPGLLDAHVEGLARIRQAHPWNPATFVPSHNDPNPRNLLFDGQRLWLVDWELGFRHDPLFDLAILSTELAAGPELEAILLAAALGRAPDEALGAKLQVVRLLTRLFYGGVVLESFAAQPRDGPEPRLEALTPEGFRAAIAEGRIASGQPETAYAFAMMSLRAFADGVAAPGFERTLALAAEA
jgi:hypothetical protein